MDRNSVGGALRRICFDPPLLLALLAVSGLGLIVLYSAGQRSVDLVAGQAIRLGLGFGIMLTLAHVPPHFFRFWSPWIYLVGISLLLAVMVAGDISKGAQRWLDLGVVRFQPSEIMKLAVPMTMAWFFADKPLQLQRLVEILEEQAHEPSGRAGPPLYQAAQVQEALVGIAAELQAQGRGIELHQVAGG